MAAATDPAARAAANGSGRQKTLPGEQGGLAAEVRRLARTESEQMALARRETNRLIAAATNVAGDPPRRVLGMIETNPPGDPAPVVAGAGAKPGPTPGPSSPSPAGAPALALAPTPLASPISAENRARLGSVLPPDAPLPAAASTPEAKAQEATILNFLEGKVVEFQVGRDQLTANGRAALNDLSKIIRKNRDTLIIVQGHTDSVGDKASNLELSGARALVARDYLVSLGVDPARLSVQGFGESKPIATNRTDEGRRRNRRIDFAVRERR
ncbi:MAG: OmpA family protein [Burkholderiaceae bacterium]